MPDIEREKVAQIFKFLLAFHQHRNPVTRQVRDHRWHKWISELPEHPSITVSINRAPVTEDTPEVDEDFILRVKRPEITAPPEWPAVLDGWILEYESPFGSIKTLEARNTRSLEGTETVQFDSANDRIMALAEWRTQWEAWAGAEKPARDAMKIFEQLYELYGEIEREGERVELVFGDGVLTWRAASGGVCHPLVLQRAELVFDASIPEFQVVTTEAPPELYSSLLQIIDNVNPTLAGDLQKDLNTAAFDPLYDSGIIGFYKQVAARLSASGTYSEALPSGETDKPVISRSPVLFLRNRNLGFPAAIEAILDDINSGATIPDSLVSIAGVERSLSNDDTDPSPRDPITDEPEDVLLSKPANREQVRIAEKLNQYGSVLVQGPPGTGKSHTIANLIGHLLARGKSVLVTSHTTKALSVLRNHVVEELRPLCVSVLDKDTESRKQLESAATAIVDRLSRTDREQLEAAADAAADHRGIAFRKLCDLRRELTSAITDEYRPILIGGTPIEPTPAAKEVAENKTNHGWIPNPIVLGSEFPLTRQELESLYQTNVLVLAEDEIDLHDPLPPIDHLPAIGDFREAVARELEYSSKDGTKGTEWWKNFASVEGAEEIDNFRALIEKAIRPLANPDSWEVAVIAAGRSGAAQMLPWTSLVTEINAFVAASAKARDNFYKYGPELPKTIDLGLQETLADALISATQSKPFSKLTSLFHPGWKAFQSESRINGFQPVTNNDFLVLREQVRLARQKSALGQRWNRQMAAMGAPSFDKMEPDPDASLQQFASLINDLLRWTTTDWKSVEDAAAQIGLNLDGLLNAQPITVGSAADLRRIYRMASGSLVEVLDCRIVAIVQRRLAAVFASWDETLQPSQSWGSASISQRLREAISSRSAEEYSSAFARLSSLIQKRTDLARRNQLLGKLSDCAPGWARAIRNREHGFAGGDSPTDFAEAWRWRQLHDELEHRGSTSIATIQAQIEDAAKDLREITTNVIDKFAWAAQLRRTDLRTRQALTGWVDIMRKIGAGTGKRVPQLKAAARENMGVCREAVPVWIMPLSRVADSFKPKAGLFDVVIIDEASQSDAMGLLAFYLGKNVVVVGDHEQVSPTAVGQDLTTINSLINTHLQGIPNSVLYDGKMSVYDLARAAFGGTICLLEHFRCVPEIIAFSNSLSYEGRIKPLRADSGVDTMPFTVEYCVDRATSRNKVNEKEALTVCALIKAALSEPEYQQSTIGVISMVGDEQAMHIERLLRKEISPVEFERRRIVCGNAAQFQGDERDIMFLSVVDAPDGGPLPLRRDAMFKQRFNVAASRARDQMWVVHSLSTSTDLKPGDLRKELIEHARNPKERADAMREAVRKSESPFETAVIEALVRRGYRVKSQVPVGYYRIDIVVEGSAKRLAVECDGERWHPPEKLADDLARQAVLERLGWTFVRIRGSLFFRDSEAALAAVFSRLEILGIQPEGPDAVQDTQDTNGLRQRVISAAEHMLRDWESLDLPSLDAFAAN